MFIAFHCNQVVTALFIFVILFGNGLFKNFAPEHGAKLKSQLDDHLLRRGNVLPPIVVDAILSTSHLWEVAEPPLVMCADLAVTPFGCVDNSNITLKVWKIQLPIVTLTFYRSCVAPIIILLAVGRKVDVSASGLAWSAFLILYETPP